MNRCPGPDIDLTYDIETSTAVVSLPASGWKSREHTIFTLSAAISRIDNEAGSRDLVEWSAVCGPFRSAEDFESGEEPPQYICNLAVFLDHADVEHAEYAVTSPTPASAQRTTSVFGLIPPSEACRNCSSFGL